MADILGKAETLEEAVFQALGAASTCWDNMEGNGVFHSERAKAIGDELVARVREEMDKPRLGFATTMDLIAEVHARAEISAINGEAWPKYKTVEGS